MLTQATWAIILTVVGTLLTTSRPPDNGLPGPILRAWDALHVTPLYDLLYTYVIFGGTVFYTLAITSVFVLRARRPDQPRPYRTWGYPFTPLLYILASLLLMGSMLSQAFVASLAGLLIILAGLPAYRYFRRHTPTAH